VLLGGDPPDRVHFLENGLAFAADVVQGQKTGFFLDQRDNRQRLAVREGEGGGAERRYPVVKS
jgi:23S rRNA (cytosine1962-C5)-methyltransferase